ncbi:uncharacterized protein PAC_11803 [Phialocephala subalpina]|uniref:Uncharacterized protein n=1 Tax=Phialocephala subalpina TaxID=576137 RepID=A0A1L7XA96_9HELO|nr:uncharacterized protein PAC_11803 [Phialocephala subalpina]
MTTTKSSDKMDMYGERVEYGAPARAFAHAAPPSYNVRAQYDIPLDPDLFEDQDLENDYSMRSFTDPAEESSQYLPHLQDQAEYNVDPTIDSIYREAREVHESYSAHPTERLPSFGFQQHHYPPSQYLPQYPQSSEYPSVHEDPGFDLPHSGSREIIEVARVKQKKTGPSKRSDVHLPRFSIKRKEMGAIRRGHAKNPKPSFQKKGPEDFSDIQISLTEFEALNEYRRQHGGKQVTLPKLMGDKKAIALRKLNSEAYDRNLKKNADAQKLEEENEE